MEWTNVGTTIVESMITILVWEISKVLARWTKKMLDEIFVRFIRWARTIEIEE